MAIIKFTRNLNRYYPNLGPVSSEKQTLMGVLQDANERFPGIIDYILDERGSIRKHVHVFVGNNAIQDRDNVGIEIEKEAEIYVMQALSGG